MLKAIRIQDVNMATLNVYEFSLNRNSFTDGNDEFPFHIVMNSNEWIVFATNGAVAYPVDNTKKLNKEDIIDLINIDM